MNGKVHYSGGIDSRGPIEAAIGWRVGASFPVCIRGSDVAGPSSRDTPSCCFRRGASERPEEPV